MGFRDAFLQTSKSYSELHLDRTIRTDPAAAIDQMQLAVKVFRDRLEEGASTAGTNQSPGSCELSDELAGLAKTSDWQEVRGATRILRQSETVRGVSRLAGLLSGPWWEVRWAVERMTQEGAAALTSALQTLPALESETLAKSIDLFEQGQYAEANDRLGKVLTGAPLQFHAHAYRGWCCVMLDRENNAQRHFQQALKIAPYPSVQGFLSVCAAQARWVSGDLPAAQDHAAMATRVAPLSAESWYGLARIAFLSAEPEQAQEALWHAVRLDALCWGAIATDPGLKAARDSIFQALGRLRSRATDAVLSARQEVEALLPEAEKAEAVQAVAQVRVHLTEMEPRLRKSNFFLLDNARRHLETDSAMLHRTAMEHLEAAKQKAAHVLHQLHIEKQNRLLTAKEPLLELRERRNAIAASYTPWQFGCLNYAALWLAFGGVLLGLDVPQLARTDDGFYTAVFLVVLLWIHPPVVIGIVNVYRKWRLLTKPLRQIEYLMRGAEVAFDRAKEEIEKEHAQHLHSHMRHADDLLRLEGALNPQAATEHHPPAVPTGVH